MSPNYLQPLPHELPDEVRLWCVDLDAYADAVALTDLPAADHERAGRILFRHEARRWLAGRHALRAVVARALDGAPGDLHFVADGQGKPRLADDALAFNLGRSGHRALIATCRGPAVGVDIELVRPVPERAALVREHLSEREREAWREASAQAEPHSDADRTFLTLWTRKEACAKALGAGVTIPPASIDAGCGPEVRVVTVAVGPARREVTVASVVFGHDGASSAAAAPAVGAVAMVENAVEAATGRTG